MPPATADAARAMHTVGTGGTPSRTAMDCAEAWPALFNLIIYALCASVQLKLALATMISSAENE